MPSILYCTIISTVFVFSLLNGFGYGCSLESVFVFWEGSLFLWYRNLFSNNSVLSNGKIQYWDLLRNKFIYVSVNMIIVRILEILLLNLDENLNSWSRVCELKGVGGICDKFETVSLIIQLSRFLY